jgi:hypothetical protein
MPFGFWRNYSGQGIALPPGPAAGCRVFGCKIFLLQFVTFLFALERKIFKLETC